MDGVSGMVNGQWSLSAGMVQGARGVTVLSEHNQPSGASSSLSDRVRIKLEDIRPAIQSDGGDIELVDVDSNGVVRVRFLGACIGCPSSAMTLTLGIERHLKNEIPEVTSVLCV
jgi:Fe-S cluster biogenesis protein NfuA